MLINPKRRRKATRKARKNVAANPRRRRRSRRKSARRNPIAANPRRRVRRRRSARRNPKLSLRGISSGVIMPAAAMGAGAVVVDLAFAALPVPATFKTGMVGRLAKIATAIGAGMIVSKFAGKKLGDAVTIGGVVTQVYGFVKPAVQSAFPRLALGEYLSENIDPYAMGYVNATPVLGQEAGADLTPFTGNEMGEYLSEYDAADMSGDYTDQ